MSELPSQVNVTDEDEIVSFSAGADINLTDGVHSLVMWGQMDLKTPFSGRMRK
jgi:hypothetical protein